MLEQIYEFVVLTLLFAWPAFILPVIIGPVILVRFKNDELSRPAGLFTLKPLAATPIWALMVALGDGLHLAEGAAQGLTLIPGIGLTLLIVWAHRDMLVRERRIALVLLGADAVRWLNTFVWIRLNASLGDLFYPAALILPNAYAVMALVMIWLRAQRGPAPITQQQP